MKRFIFILIVFQAMISCQKEDGINPMPKLLNCNVCYLEFMDDVKYNSESPHFYDTTKVSYKYLGEKIVLTNGGLTSVPYGTRMYYCIFSKMAYDTIIYNQNNILVYTKPERYFYNGDQPKSPTIYLLNDNKSLMKLIRRDGYEYNYTYLENQIIEKNKDGRTLRKFYLENNNLTKVVKEYYDNGKITYKKEIIFQKYDNHPNPFKNKYYLTGAFYKAFSENNYTELIVNEYNEPLSDGTFNNVMTYKYSFPINYEPNAYPEFGEYQY